MLLSIVFSMVIGSIMLSSLEKLAKRSAAPEVRPVIDTLYSELTTIGTVGIILFLGSSMGWFGEIGLVVYGEHPKMAVDGMERPAPGAAGPFATRVDRIDKILLLLMLVFVVSCVGLVIITAARFSDYEKLERLARRPDEVLAAAAATLRQADGGAAAKTELHSLAEQFQPENLLRLVGAEPRQTSTAEDEETEEDGGVFGAQGDEAAEEGRGPYAPSAAAAAAAATGSMPTFQRLSSLASSVGRSLGPPRPEKHEGLTFATPDDALDAVRFLTLRHQLLYQLRKQRSPPVKAGFDFGLYLRYCTAQDMTSVVGMEASAWLTFLLVLLVVAPTMIALGNITATYVLFTILGCLPPLAALCLGQHLRMARDALTDPTLVRAVTSRALGLSSGEHLLVEEGSAAASVASDDLSTAQLRHRGGRGLQSASADAGVSADASSSSSSSSPAAAAAAGSGILEDEAALPAASEALRDKDGAVTSLVAHGWPRLRGDRAAYRAADALRRSHHAAPARRYWCCGSSAVRETLRWCGMGCCLPADRDASAHARLLLFKEQPVEGFRFTLTFLNLVNAVYAAITIGLGTYVFVHVAGVWIGLLWLLAQLVPALLYIMVAPRVVADVALVTSVEQLVRRDCIRTAAVAQQSKLAEAAVKVLACLANTQRLRSASQWSLAQRRKRFEQAKSALGRAGVRAATAEAGRLFNSFLRSGQRELAASDLRLLLSSMGVVGTGGSSPEEDDQVVAEVLAAMDLDALEDGAPADPSTVAEEQTVSLQEFVQWYITSGPGSPNTASDDLSDIVDGVFAVLKPDDDGEVRLESIHEVLLRLDPNLDAGPVLAAWDSDQSGTLSKEELLRVLKDSLR